MTCSLSLSFFLTSDHVCESSNYLLIIRRRSLPKEMDRQILDSFILQETTKDTHTHTLTFSRSVERRARVILIAKFVGTWRAISRLLGHDRYNVHKQKKRWGKTQLVIHNSKGVAKKGTNRKKELERDFRSVKRSSNRKT